MSDPKQHSGMIAWFASNPVAANLLMVLVIVAGLMTVGSLRKEAFPAAEPDSISITVSYLSGSAEQSEEGLALKIEDALEDVSGIKTLTSTSTSTGVSVTVERTSGYDLNELLRDVQTRIDGLSNLPADADNPVVEKAVRESDAISLQLYGDVGRHSLQQLAESLRSDLLAKPHISSVSYGGWLDPMMLIEVDEARLQAYGLSLSDVQKAINLSSSKSNSAILRNKSLYLQLKAAEQAYFKQQFAQLPLVTLKNGNTLYLGEVAKIRDTFDDSSAVLSRFNGANSIALNVVSSGQEDVTDTVSNTLQVVEQWHSSGRLPDNVQLVSWNDRSENIRSRLTLLVKNGLGGILLVFLLLAIFLNLKVAFWVAMGLPFIFFGTFFVMGDNLLGMSLNEFTTFGFIMALGIVVDDAVVVGESVFTTRSRYGDTQENTLRGTMLVAVPTLFGIFTTVAAFAALSLINGKLGELYAQFGIIVTICLLLSMVESKLILPAHLSHLNTRKILTETNWLAAGWHKIQHLADAGLNWFNTRIYRAVIEFAIVHRYAVMLIGLSIFVLVVAMPFNGTVRISFFPDVSGTSVSAQISMQNDASYGQTHRALQQLEQQAVAVDKDLLGQQHSDLASGIQNLHVLAQSDQAGQITIELTDNAPYSIQDFTRRWKSLAGMPEGVRTLNIASSMRAVDALRVELRASDNAALMRAGAKFKQYLESLPAVSGISDNLSPGQPQLFLKLSAQGRALGMTKDELASQIYQAFSGQVVQRYQRNSDEIEVKVRYPDSDRQSPMAVLNARVRTPDGAVVPVSSVATAVEGYARDSITRIDGKRAVYISAEVDKEAQSVSELVSGMKKGIALDLQSEFPGLDIHFAGEAEQQAETTSSMEMLSLLALIVIYMLLAIPLKSYVQPLLIMSAIPFGIVGAILGHLINDLSLSILSLNGVIALSGVVVNDSLLLVSSYNDKRMEGIPRFDAIQEACTSRLRAVLLTSITTFAGLMPLLGETDMQAQFLIPAAVSLAYGILFATFVTLILIPALVMIQEDLKHHLGKIFFTKHSEALQC